MNKQYDPQTNSRRHTHKTKILLVEDNPDHQQLIQKVLQTCMPGVELLTATTSEEVFHLLERCVNTQSPLPRLILLDLYLPEREVGWTLLQRLKERTSPFRLIPLTLLSQSAKADDVQTAYQLGANSYIAKPVDYPQWVDYFKSLQQYWLHTVTLPHL